MKYVSTRGRRPVLGFADVLLAGLAPDGGLYVPEDVAALAAARPAPAAVRRRRRRGDVAVRRGSIDRDEFAALVDDAYADVRPPGRVPAGRAVGDGLWLLELFHGPTLAFKDVALQLVGRLFDHELTRAGRAGDDRRWPPRATPARRPSRRAVGRDALDIVVLHPAGRVSEVQRRQMTTVDAPNVHNVAVEGTFDDCQDLVKAMFADVAFRDEHPAVGRELDQLGPGDGPDRLLRDRRGARSAPGGAPVSFAVPTGNFGNVLAGWFAQAMGVPIERLVVGSNRNDILTRWVDTGALVDRGGRADAQPGDGHPGVVEPRAPAVRAARPRRRRRSPS